MNQDHRRLIILISAFSLLAVLILNFFFFQKSDEESYFEEIQETVREIDKEFDEDYIQLLMAVSPEESVTFETVSSNQFRHPFFILDSEKRLIIWSDFTLSFDFSTIEGGKEYQLLTDPYGTFLVKNRKISRNGKTFWMVHAFRLIWPGSIENDFLETGANPLVFGNNLFELKAPEEEASFVVKNPAGIPLFGIDFKLGYLPSGRIANPAILIFFTSVFLLYFILSSGFVLKKWRKGRRWQAIGYGALVLLGFRLVMLVLNFPGTYFNFPLFDPANYASSWLNPSLGDLLINSICGVFIFGMIIFQLASPKTHKKIKIFDKDQEFKIISGAAFLISSLGFGLIWYLPGDLVRNSQWPLDISAIPTFGFFEGISFTVVFLWAAVYVLLGITLSSLLLEVRADKKEYFKGLAVLGFPVLILFLLVDTWLGIAWFLHVVFLALTIKFSLFKNVFRLGLNTFLTFFFAGLITAGISGMAIFQTEKEQLIQAKTRFANQNLIESDVMTEFFLGEIFTRIKSDLFIQNRMADPLLSKDPIDAKIRRIYLDNYFDQFEVKVSLFSPTGQDYLNAMSGAGLKELRDKYIKSDYLTGVKDLYFIRGREGNIGNKFIAFINLTKDGSSLGTLFLELNQLRIQPGSVYPKLLLDKKYSEKLNPIQFDYAIFKDEELIRNSGTFNYLSAGLKGRLAEKKLLTEGIHANGFHHFGIQNEGDIIVISSENRPFSYFFGNISLFFVVFVFLTFISILLHTLLKGYQNFEFNYSTKLQLYLNFAFFFPIIIISIITVGLLANSYREDLDRQYIQKAALIRGNLASFLGNRGAEEVDQDALNEEVSNLANTIGSDIYLYSASGKLESTNRPNIFDKKILSEWINPEALSELVEKNQIQFLADETVGKLHYKSVYLSIPSANGQQNSAILSVPFFESETELNTLIADVLSNIFNAFVVIFILFLVVSYFVSQNLTFPFRLLTQKLKTTNLENNEPMYWDSKDEIGLLVNEYNNMLYKLEASKKVLASTEKESAWREMAKQVAHEIKNPLTPMKLTLQHLLRLQEAGRLDDLEKLKKSLETLIHQVDALSGIASSFSTFAKMPLPKNELMNFKEVLGKVLDLFKNDQRLDLSFQDDSYTDNIPIFGDDKLFGRVISNLIINGVQAVAPGVRPSIKVWLWLTEKAVFLEITDNGKGIPPELRDKIFVPNFSTKSTGSGLGLAIAKSGVETAGGKIWFETELGKGTTFYLTFPLAE
ncbi:HAMP domain-containing sensor histidine kinase [Algoriphagus sp. CAU 1675]|uniref:sensor histidine kinase n=1 Tax=Algoriphagus sp. CAU 1675 TaxID=3032597 RepID=UPI0023D9F78C|nr:HAMP domain-containing sensor histidine kinase [Algoriphagus sp. CAU 1675]MDF2159204.1 HAMP domain-containing sensor histidine kinase [Algoriphagus sp. CAU 1675]